MLRSQRTDNEQLAATQAREKHKINLNDIVITLERILGSAATIVDKAFMALVLTCTAGSFNTLSN